MIGRYTVATPLGPVRLASDERLVSIEPCRLALPSQRADALSVLLRMASVSRPGALGDRGPLIASLANPENAANPELRRYEAVFGRDALYSAAFLADLYPQLEAGTVCFLAGFQASKNDPLALAAPGKIPNHIRDPGDPLARTLTAQTGRRWPWFGGTDTTVLFLSAACRVIDRDAGALDWPVTGGRRLRDAIAAAGRWLLGELRQDLLWAYLNRKDSYTVWTDSPNAFHHADGTLASPPVAPVQLQAEVHDALRGLARHATALGLPGARLDECAQRIRACLRTAFIVDHRRGPFLAAALSNRGEPLAVRTVGMGMALDSAAFDGHDIVRSVAGHLFSPDMLSPFGVAGRARDEVRFEPFDYHSQVWAFAVHRAARGLARHGCPDLARELDLRVLEQARDGLFPENVGACPDLRYCPHVLTVARPAPDGRPTVTVKERPPAPYAAWTVAAVLAIRNNHAGLVVSRGRAGDDMKRWLVPSLAGLAGGIAGYGAISGGLTGTPTTSQLLWSVISAVIGATIGFFTAAAGGLGIERLRREHMAEHQATAAGKRLFFLSYHTADQTWAEWVAAVVGTAGCHVVRQSWNFTAGQDLATRARESRAQASGVIVLLSSAFLASPYSRDDWIDQLLAPGHDPLTVVRVEPCHVPERLPVDADLAGQSAATAASLVLAAVGVPAAAAIADARITRDFPGLGPAVCNLPARNENFTDRLEVLDGLQRVLLAEAGAGTSQVCVLHGLGGVGKTQTAIEFAYRFGSHYDVIWWIRAEQAVGISDHLTWLARELGIGDFPEHSRMIAALWQELRHRDRWLLIYDNARSPVALAPYWPTTGTGDVLVTSRHRAWGGYGATVQVQPFAPLDAVTFLRKRAKAADELAADAVAEALGCLPLALEQAAAYVEETQTSLESYRQLLAADHPGLLAAGRPQWYGETVATTWAVSVATACQEQPQARAALAVLAYLAPDDIPRDLLHQHSGVLEGPLGEVAADRVAYDLLLASMIGFSLITADPHRISIHRLVQLTIRNQLTAAERTAFRACAVRLLAAAFPDDSSDKAAWPACGRLLPHVSGLVDSPGCGELAIVLHRAGRYLHRRGDYPEARRFLERALAIRASAADVAPAAHGTSALREAETLTALSRLYYHTADLGKARKCTERALELYRAAAGEGTRPVIENTIHLSRVLRELGDFDGAERVAGDLARVAPPGPVLAAARQVHGDALFRLGRLDEAQDAYADALAMRHGTAADPLDLAACHKHLGIIAAEDGDLDTAEHQLRSARALLVQDYDEDNLDVIDVDNHLADILRRTGRPEQARDLLVHVISARERLVGPHPDLAGSLTRYGAVLAALGDHGAAIDVLRRAQAMFADRMGAGHPYVAEAGVVLAAVLRDAGEPGAALDRAEHALSIYTAAYGAEHRVTRQTRALRDELRRG